MRVVNLEFLFWHGKKLKPVFRSSELMLTDGMCLMFVMVTAHIAPSTCTFNVRVRFCTFAKLKQTPPTGLEPVTF